MSNTPKDASPANAQWQPQSPPTASPVARLGGSAQSFLTEAPGSEQKRRVGHTMIGLALHAADQPGAAPETRTLAQRLRARHPATNIGE